MQYYRCKCGKSEAWSTMGTRPCEGCPECNTTLEQSPKYHKEPEPHEFVTMYHEHTGKPYQRCMRCLHKEGYEEASKRGDSHDTEKA